MDTEKCRVCRTALTQKYSKCPYCGYGNKVILTVSNDDSEAYRQEILEKIKDISVTAERFRFSENKKGFEHIGSRSLFDSGLDGVKCSQNTVLSKEKLSHFDSEAKLMANYVFAGKKKSVQVRIAPRQNEGYWYLCLRINEKLKLEIGLYTTPINGKGNPRSELLAEVDLNLTE